MRLSIILANAMSLANSQGVCAYDPKSIKLGEIIEVEQDGNDCRNIQTVKNINIIQNDGYWNLFSGKSDGICYFLVEPSNLNKFFSSRADCITKLKLLFNYEQVIRNGENKQVNPIILKKR